MKDMFPRGSTAIVATATHESGEAPGLSSMDLAVGASVKALASVGLTPGDVDALFVATPDDFLSGLTFAEYLAYIHALPKTTARAAQPSSHI